MDNPQCRYRTSQSLVNWTLILYTLEIARGFQMLWRTWPSDCSSIRAWSEWLGPAICKGLSLEMPSIRAWPGWPCPIICRFSPSAMHSPRAWTSLTCFRHERLWARFFTSSLFCFFSAPISYCACLFWEYLPRALSAPLWVHSVVSGRFQPEEGTIPRTLHTLTLCWFAVSSA